MNFRAYAPADRSACIAIFNSNVPRFFDPAELADFEVWLNGLDEGRLAYGQTESEYYYVVEMENRVVACGGFYVPRGEIRANLVWGMVDNSLHRKGIGRAFLEYRLNLIKTISPQAMVSLDTTQHSFEFFETLGFSVTKITKDFYGKDLDRYDMVR